MKPVDENCGDADVMSSAFGHESLSAALARHCEGALSDGVVVCTDTKLSGVTPLTDTPK